MSGGAVNTVQELIEGHYEITIYCHNPRCHHRAVLDLLNVRERLGPDHGMLFEDMWKVVCSRCGGREFGMSTSPDPMNKGKGWT